MKPLKAVFEGGKFRLLEPPENPLSEGQLVEITVSTEKPTQDALALAGRVYEGLSDEEIASVESIALDRKPFFADSQP